MPIEQYYGVHATCFEYASIIKEEGFILSPEDRYLGAGVYFYDKNKKGDNFANIHKQKKIRHGHCKEGDPGVLINAKISSSSERILNLEADEYISAFESIKNDFWEEYNKIDLPHKEKNKRLNRRRFYFLLSILEDIGDIDFVKAPLPYNKNKYASGFVVYNTKCIDEISY